MNELPLVWLLSVVSAWLIDSAVRPRSTKNWARLRAWSGLWITGLVITAVFGIFSAVSGSARLSVIATLAVQLVLAIGSNAKRRVLGEPLVFSDLALLGAMLKHPQFYFSVLALWQKIAGLLGVVSLVGVIVWLFEPALRMAAIGSGIAVAAIALLALSLRIDPWRKLAARPDLEADLAALGLLPTLLLYWRRWREARAQLSPQDHGARVAQGGEPDKAGGNEVLVIVQCESFADPEELFGEGGAHLPELARAKVDSVQWGNLEVSGFGAYTMRTEYAVLFGRGEEELGFLKYDPYLTACDDPALALPRVLGTRSWRSFFVHPHDMRFYDRARILPKAGFAELVGEDRFAHDDLEGGRYVRDARVADKILELVDSSSQRTLIYAVTMENHGPWAPHGDAGTGSMVANYNRLVLAGDAMLGQLREGLETLGRPTTLVFFGDHRPTIPGASDPGGDRHTPYAILRFGQSQGAATKPGKREDLTPAQLHHTILAETSVRSG